MRVVTGDRSSAKESRSRAFNRTKLMEETGQEEVRPGSANSDNGLDGGFVEVTEEDAQMAQWDPSPPPPVIPPAMDDDADLYGDDREGEDQGAGEDGEEGGAVDDLENEKPLSPPPSPVDGVEDTTSGQLIDFDFSDVPTSTYPSQTLYGEDTLLVATPPEPLIPSALDSETLIGFEGGPDTSDPFASATHTDMAFNPSSSTTVDDMFVDIAEMAAGNREPTPPPSPSPERDPTPPPVPKWEPTPPPPERDPTPPPPPERDPTPPPPVPERDPTPPPPPPKDPTPPSLESHGVEEITPTPTPTTTTKTKKGHMPKPRGYLKFLKTFHPVVLYIIYWCDIKLSAVVLGVCLVILLTLTLNTLLHTMVLLLLSFMVVSLTYIVSKIIIDSFYNKRVTNPFNTYLEKQITLPEDMLLEWTLYVIRRLEVKINELVRLLLFANIKHSLAFGVGLWLASFVTNYLTLLSALFVIVGVAFTVPWLYDCFQEHIDTYMDIAITQLGTVSRKVLTYVPFMSKKKAD